MTLRDVLGYDISLTLSSLASVTMTLRDVLGYDFCRRFTIRFFCHNDTPGRPGL